MERDANASSHFLLPCKIFCLSCMDFIILDISPEVINQTLNDGDTALFTCQATGNPIPNISWYFNGVPVKKDNATKYNIMISEMSLNSIAKSSTLTIMNVQSPDIGTYTCEAINFASTDTSSGVLTIKGKNIAVLHYDKHVSFIMTNIHICMIPVLCSRFCDRYVWSPQ